MAQAASALQTARLLEKVTYQARHDGLTGLSNRMVFTEAMEHALATARETGESFGLLFVDLDDFKGVNDELGHHAGDELLCEVSRRLLASVRGDIVARLGGDEFGILLSGIKGTDDADVAVERVLHSFDEPFVVGGELLPLVGERRPRTVARRRRRDGGADAPRRHRDVPRQARGAPAQPRDLARPGDSLDRRR